MSDAQPATRSAEVVDPVDVVDVVDVVMVGGGNMGAALLGGMIESGVFAPGMLAVVELLDARRNELVDMFPGVAIVDAIPPCRSAVLAVKPPGVPAATTAAVAAGATRLLSIAAGVNIATIEAAAGDDVA
ncbi:MAG: NAD(P)-binding domain-containing protein, partial [Ilumatobacter sp.]|nr:NAD(P)-binding domain-containing protein [Ilumatobacter sp.]